VTEFLNVNRNSYDQISNMNNQINSFQMKLNQLLSIHNDLQQKIDEIVLSQHDCINKEQNIDQSLRKINIKLVIFD
jgi:hypothetical protein